MTYKNILLESLKESFALIWKNKLWFLLLFVIEILFFIAISITSYNYQIEIVKHSNAIFEYISTLNLDEANVAENLMQQKNIFGDDPLLISREFNEILRNFRLLLILIFFIMIIFLSFCWVLTSKIMHKINFKSASKLYSKTLVILLFYLGLIFIFLYSLLNFSLSQIYMQTSMLATKFVTLLIVTATLIYFMFISLSLIHKTGLKSIVQKTLVVGIKKVHYVLGVYAINMLFISISVLIFFKFFERSILALFVSTILLFFSLAFGRFFIVNTFEKLV